MMRQYDLLLHPPENPDTPKFKCNSDASLTIYFALLGQVFGHYRHVGCFSQRPLTCKKQSLGLENIYESGTIHYTSTHT